VDAAERVRIRYTSKSSGETTERVIRPFNIHFYDGREFLEAFCELRGADRLFAVAGIEAILEPAVVHATESPTENEEGPTEPAGPSRKKSKG
jgi:predicted DNA-binding transcriptional regulator YafY